MAFRSTPTQRKPAPGPGDAARPEPAGFDFRRTERFSADAVRSLEAAHEIFTRRVGTSWGASLRAMVQVEIESVAQVSYDDHVRSMPNPNVVGLVALPPLPGVVLVDVNVQLGLQLVDRLLGAGGEADLPMPASRRPTELEGFLLEDLLQTAARAIGETLDAHVQVTSDLTAIEYNPQLVQVANPSDSVLLLTFRVKATQGIKVDGLLTVCYSAATLAPILDGLRAQAADSAPAVDAEWQAQLSAGLGDVEAEVRVGLAPCQVPATDLARLQVGDVLRLDHRVDQPVLGHIGDVPLLSGHAGRRGRRLALQVTRTLTSFDRSTDEH